MQVVTSEEMYAIDRYTIAEIGLAGPILMENAGRAAVRAMLGRLSVNDTIGVMIGAGNNGGDGFVIARVLKDAGYDVEAWLVPPSEKIKGDALQAMRTFEQCGYSYRSYVLEGAEVWQQSLNRYSVIIDTLLGIGAKGSLRPPYRDVIQQINAHDALVIAIDLPSGVPADGGVVTEALKADMTITLQAPKLSAFTFPSRSFYGTLHTVSIGIPPLAFSHVGVNRFLWTADDVGRTFPRRQQNSHKGTYGRGLLIGGSRGMVGAPVMAARAALRTGVGLLTLGVPETAYQMIAGQVVEAMYTPLPADGDFVAGELPVERSMYDAMAVGPGLGRTQGGAKVVEQLLKADTLLMIDADGLFHMPTQLDVLAERTAPTILTPHEGEMARLCNCTVDDVQQNRFTLSHQFATTYGVYLVLKGPYTIVTTPDGVQYVNTSGNAALAKGGSGDVLTGMILGFVLQQQSIQTAISNAVYSHGAVADALIRQSHASTSLIATDIIDQLPHTLQAFEGSHSL